MWRSLRVVGELGGSETLRRPQYRVICPAGPSRRGVGSALLRLAEQHARSHGAKSIQIQASLAGVEFYRVNGFEALEQGKAVLISGKSMACVQMRKILQPPDLSG